MDQVVILGGGRGAIALANMLALKVDGRATVTLVHPSDHVDDPQDLLRMPFRSPRVPDLARRLSDTVLPGVQLRRDRPRLIDPMACRVEFERTPAMEYDYLAIATGAEPDLDAVPLFTEAADHVSTPEGAQALRSKLQAFKSGEVLVIDAHDDATRSFAGLEFACRLHEYLLRQSVRERCRLTLTTPGPELHAVDPIDRFFSVSLADRGIAHVPHFHVSALDEARSLAIGMDGKQLPWDLGVVFPPLRGALGLIAPALTDEAGWVRVNPELLRTPSFENIWALGDAAALPLPKGGGGDLSQVPVVAVQIIFQALRRGAADVRYDGRACYHLDMGHERSTHLQMTYEEIRPLPTPTLQQYYEQQLHEVLWLGGAEVPS